MAWKIGLGATYFHTMGIPLLQGREFGEHDTTDSQRAVIFGPCICPAAFLETIVRLDIALGMGRRLMMQNTLSWEKWGTRGWDDLRSTPSPVAYFSIEQRPAIVGTIVVRGDGEDGGLLAEIRQILLNVEPDLPIAAITPLNAEYEEGLSREILLARATRIDPIHAL